MRLAAASLLLAALVPAQQSIVVPASQAAAEGNSLDHKPFGYMQVRLHHYIGRSELVGLGSAAQIKGLRYRGEGGMSVAMTRSAATSWTVRMANTASDPMNPPARYTATTQLTTVFGPKAVAWPTLPVPASAPAGWLIAFPLDLPFAYAGGHLLVDHQCVETTSTVATYLCDWETAAWSSGSAAAFGAGCPAGESRITGIIPNPGGGDLALYLHGGHPGAAALAGLGVSNSSWAGLPLPYPLSNLGLSGCAIYTDLALLAPAPVLASGLAEWSAPVPPDPSLLGARLFAQFLSLNDPRVSAALPITTSEALDLRLGVNLGFTAPRMSVVYGTQSLASSSTGFVFRGEGPVVQIEF